jgi:site-specific recombinase XerC
VQRLLTESNGDRLTDIRDRAILMLLTVYGLRSAELRGLRLEDLDWEMELIHNKQAQAAKGTTLPTRS